MTLARDTVLRFVHSDDPVRQMREAAVGGGSDAGLQGYVCLQKGLAFECLAKCSAFVCVCVCVCVCDRLQLCSQFVLHFCSVCTCLLFESGNLTTTRIAFPSFAPAPIIKGGSRR